MKRFQFMGNSDDTFGEYSETKDDYDNCASGEPIQYEVSLSDGSGILVTGIYGGKHGMGNGCWMIGVESLDEDKPVDWVINMYPSHLDYHNLLIVVAPDDAVCRHRKSEEGV